MLKKIADRSIIKIKRFIDLEVWKKSANFSLEIYKITRDFPKNELFGITSQIRRASNSIGANIAEGFGRYYFKDKIRFYYQARGSVTETQHFLLLSFRHNFINKEVLNKLFNEADRINAGIMGLIKSIKKNQ